MRTIQVHDKTMVIATNRATLKQLIYVLEPGNRAVRKPKPLLSLIEQMREELAAI